MEIIKAAEGAASLTKQLLAFSRRQIFQLRVLDCNAVIRNTQKMLKRLIGEDIDLALDLAKEESRAKADPGQLEQVIMNLIVLIIISVMVLGLGLYWIISMHKRRKEKKEEKE